MEPVAGRSVRVTVSTLPALRSRWIPALGSKPLIRRMSDFRAVRSPRRSFVRRSPIGGSLQSTFLLESIELSFEPSSGH